MSYQLIEINKPLSRVGDRIMKIDIRIGQSVKF